MLKAGASALILAYTVQQQKRDANRYLEKDGKRYSHVLDPRTGWPVTGAPHAVTVIAATCTDAGMLSTLALLQGSDAENFLKEQDVLYWCQW